MFTAKSIGAPFANQPKDPFFNNNVILLHGDGVNSSNNTVFLDSSNNAVTITTNGKPYQGSQTPFSTVGWSYYFNTATSDYISASSVAAIGTNDFTFECWINPSTYVSSMIAGNWSPAGGNTERWQFIISATGVLQWQMYTDNNTTGTITVPLNKWTHVAISRISGIVYQFVNGVLDNTGTSTLSITSGINFAGAAGGTFFNGYISNARLVIGKGLYNTTFTPSSSALITVNSTALLTAQSNQFVGSNTTVSNVAITISGNTQIQPSSPFAPTDAYSKNKVGGSIYFNGTADYLTIPNNINFNLGSNNFTIEAWIYPTSSATESIIINKVASGSVVGSFDIRYTTGKTIIVYYSNVSGGLWSGNFTTSGTVPLNQWTHIALVRNGSVFTTYLNGVSSGTQTNGSVGALVYESSVTLNTGANGDGSSKFKGYMSNVRIINGNAVYTGQFTPSLVPLTTAANTVLLLNSTNAGIIDSSQKNNLSTFTSAAVVSNTQSKFGGSSISLTGASSSYITIPYKPYFDIPANTPMTFECWAYATSFTTELIFANRNWSYGASGPTWGFHLNASVNGLPTWGIAGTGSSTYTMAQSPIATPLNQWNHFAFTRDSSNVVRIFTNGILGVSRTDGQAMTATSGDVFIGTPSNLGTFSTGFIDDMRFSLGVARYTSPFTPPVRQLPNR